MIRVAVEDIYCFLGLVVYMSLNSTPDYRRIFELYSIPFPKRVMSALPGSPSGGSEKDLCAVQWRDTRDVLICSTMNAAQGKGTVCRWVKGHDGRWTVADFLIPPAVKDYKKYVFFILPP